jgi:hypothetical protein
MQLLRQGNAKVFKKYSQMKLQMKREALAKLNRQANEAARVLAQSKANPSQVLAQSKANPSQVLAQFGTVGQRNSENDGTPL